VSYRAGPVAGGGPDVHGPGDRRLDVIGRRAAGRILGVVLDFVDHILDVGFGGIRGLVALVQHYVRHVLDEARRGGVARRILLQCPLRCTLQILRHAVHSLPLACHPANSPKTRIPPPPDPINSLAEAETKIAWQSASTSVS
jgi:hypothetical protein